uniref:regenerating islet-derived protein 4-like n=1 Tax=Euleptes europaea TaxID=460621 RepID=UPI0025426333|nr:regenerating islet-derived protein 4-like [Euleptes europaea]
MSCGEAGWIGPLARSNCELLEVQMVAVTSLSLLVLMATHFFLQGILLWSFHQEADMVGGRDEMVGRRPIWPLFGLLAIHFLLQGCNASECPNGWVKYQRQCYGVFFKKQDWLQAEMECQNYGNHGHLVSIISNQEGEVLSTHILNNFPDGESFWIGLRDRLKKGLWRWSDLSTSMYTAWVDGAPKNVDESGFCAYVSVKQKFLKWNDTFCNTQMAFICEILL